MALASEYCFNDNSKKLYVRISNLQTFRSLMEQAEKDAEALFDTLHRLEALTLEITLEEGGEEYEQRTQPPSP